MGCSNTKSGHAPRASSAPHLSARRRGPALFDPKASLADAQVSLGGGNSSLRPERRPSKEDPRLVPSVHERSPVKPRAVKAQPALTRTADHRGQDYRKEPGARHSSAACWAMRCFPFLGSNSSYRPVAGGTPEPQSPNGAVKWDSAEPDPSDWIRETSEASCRTLIREMSTASTRTSFSSITSRGRLVVTNLGRIQEDYAFEGRELGHLGFGGYSTVSKGRRRADGAVRAIKAIDLERTSRSSQSLERLSREIAIMKRMDHPGIIKLYETWEDKKDLYLVMELCVGGELFRSVLSAGRFTEEEAAIVMRQVMSAIVYMHESGVCHRDIKAENFLFLSNAPIQDNVLKLIDFGLSHTFEAGAAKFWTKIGTPYYVAPQVLLGCYDELIDVWSAGILMYVLLCGHPPFMGDTDVDIIDGVLSGKVEFAPEEWDMISEDAKELNAWMLAFRPERRSSAKQALDHVWIHDMAPHVNSTAPLCARRVQNLQKFCSMHPFKRATLGVIASLLHEDKIAELRDMFRGMDQSGTGVLSARDLMEGMSRAGISEIALDLLEMQQVVKAFADEGDGSGGIRYTEFLAAAMDEAHYLQEDICWSAFCAFDRDGDGKISRSELGEVLRDDGVDMALAHAMAQELIREIDRVGDGTISFDEFMRMLREQHW